MKLSLSPFKFFAGVFVILLTAMSGCQFDPFADGYTRNRPNESGIIGTYILVRQTLTSAPITELTASDGSHPSQHKLTLHADGTFSMINMPIWTKNTVRENRVDWSISKFVSVTGRWEVRQVGSVGEWTGKLSPVWGLDLSSRSYSSSLSLSGEKQPYSFVFAYGDPDNGDAMIYEKK